MSVPIKILIAEHDSHDLELLQYQLKKDGINYISEVVQNEPDYVSAIKRFVPDIILSDYSFPSFDGPTAFKIREAMTPDTPFILVSGTIGEVKAVELIKNGVTDYALKDKMFSLTPKIIRALKEAKERELKNRTEHELIQNERQLAKAQQLAHMGSWELDFATNIVLWSDEACRIYGLTLDQNRQSFETWLSYIPPENAEFAKEKIQEAYDTFNDSSFNFRFIRKDGAIRYGYTEWRFEFDKKGAPVKLYGILQDITLQKEAEEKLNKANHLYAFISQVNQNIVRVKDEATLFRNSCQIAIEFGKFKMAWIGIFDKKQKKINLVEQSGILEQDLSLFTNTPCQQNGPQDHVLRTGTFYICNDIENDLQLENWKPFAAKYNIRSCLVLPIKKSGNIIGTFNFYAAELNFSSREEIELLIELTGDISFALDLFEKAKKHKETEELVIQNEKRYRALIENNADMITLITDQGELMYSSPSVKRILGYSNEELLHKPDHEFIHPDDLPGFVNNIANILQVPGKTFYNEQRVLHKNGKWIWCEGAVTNLLHQDGVGAIVSNFRDISERKLAEQNREFDKNNLNALINNTNDLMWSVDRDFKLITSNQPFDEITRLRGKTIEPESSILSGSVSEEQANRFKMCYERAFNDERFVETEYNKDPVEHWMEISYCPIRKGNEVIGAACHSRNITERKKTEQLLRKSEAFNRGILNSLNSQIAVVDHLGNIIAVNESWKRFALENGETSLQRTCVGSNYFDVCEKSAKAGLEVASEVLHGMKDVMNEDKTIFYLEYPCHSPDVKRWFGMRIMKFDSDEPMIVVAHQDISERKLAEEELIFNNEVLRKTNAELDRFVYSTSHDLRSPLTSILGLLYFIEVESKETATLVYAKMIRTSIERLDGFIKNILYYSRNNRTELELIHIPLQKTLDEIVNSLRNMEEAERINFEVNIDEQTPFYSDGQRFNAVIENLISNAIKYQNQDRTEKYVKISGWSDIDYLHLQIEDNGVGIAHKFLNKIFDMFFRMPSKKAGTGIGLYIVKETVDKLEGIIRVDSEEGSGTTFTLKLKNLIT